MKDKLTEVLELYRLYGNYAWASEELLKLGITQKYTDILLRETMQEEVNRLRGIINAHEIYYNWYYSEIY